MGGGGRRSEILEAYVYPVGWAVMDALLYFFVSRMSEPYILNLPRVCMAERTQ